MFYAKTDMKMPFGKHRGKTFDTIYQEDRSYLSWMAQACIFRGGINYSQMAADYLKEQNTDTPETTYKCSECGKLSKLDIFRECPFCADSLCIRCFNLHDTMHKQARTSNYQQHYQSHTHREYQQTYTSGVSQELIAAFSVLQLSTRATVQEVKRAFRRKAKEAHPDTGGSEQVFKALNAAYQLALAHAERNER